MASIYEQHEVAFPHVSAFAIVQQGKRIGSIAFKFPRNGAGRLWCYVQVFGAPMVRGQASGYGYDKRSAACVSAVRNLLDGEDEDDCAAHIAALKKALSEREGYGWDRRIEDAGYELFQAV